MLPLFQFILSDFWVFIGFIITLSTVLHFIFNVWNRAWRHLNIRKSGWPPPHLDADGDFKPKEDKDN